jgi:hypothetical protein
VTTDPRELDPLASLLSDESLLAELFAGAELAPLDAAAEVTEELLLPSAELGRVARRIAGSYVTVIARHAAVAFGREHDEDADLEVRSAVDALRRLAQAARDEVQLALLDELDALLDDLAEPRSRAGRRALAALTDWIPRFASTLEPEDAGHLLGLVHWERGSVPLLEELATIRGIGRKRLARLYAAGLFSVDTVANASPEEIVQVTGLPRSLAEKVVERTRQFAEDERRRCVTDLRDRAMRLSALVRSFRSGDDGDGAVGLVEEATAVLQQALRELSGGGGVG